MVKVCRTLPNELKARYRLLEHNAEIIVVSHIGTLVIPVLYEVLHKLHDIDKIVIYIIETIKYMCKVYDILDNAIIYI